MSFPRLSDRLSTALILLAISLAVSLSGGLGRLDFVLYDLGQKLNARPAPADLVLVAIDEESLSQLGRWPWPRLWHAQLLERLEHAGAKVVGLDIVFAEPDARDTAADAALADAMQRAGNVVLPVLLENNRQNGQLLETLPLPRFANAAAAMGHVHAELDEDGIARSVFLREGVGTPAWPGFALAVLGAANAIPPSMKAAPVRAEGQPFAISRQDQRMINFFGPPGQVPSLSYVQVLKGEFPADAFKDKIVLVGATAAGLGDQLPTPVSGLSRQMPGVEFHAHVLESIRQGTLVARWPGWLAAIACAALALAPIAWLPRLQPLQGLLVSSLWLLMVAGLGMLLPRLVGVWLPVSAALSGILMAYPVWSWRKLESAGRFLDMELQRLRLDDGEAAGGRRSDAGAAFDDVIQARIQQVQDASQRLRRLQEERRETLAFISHDIRAPLVQAMMNLDEGGREPVDRLRAQLARALRLAEDFLHTSRAEMLDAGQFREVDLTAVLHQAMDDGYAYARAKGVSLHREIPMDPVWLRGDFGLLHRAVLNVILNAIRHAPQGSAVGLALQLAGFEAVIGVTDHGPGIPAEQIDRLFQRYSRSVGSDPEGAGLGLYFVRVAAEKHGGSVDVASTPGHGASFVIRLPLEAQGPFPSETGY